MQVVLIPAYKPDEKFTAFMNQLVAAGFTVVSVDDGSGVACRHYFEEVQKLGVTVVSYPTNQGKGSALKTGFEYIINNFPQVTGVITADCDGQHTLKDLKRISRWMKRYPDRFFIGGRFSSMEDIPARSAFGNNLIRKVYKFATGFEIRDTQTGLRGIPANLLSEMLKIKGNRYEYEMNMLLSLGKWDVHFTEIPIETIYIEKNASSHFRPMFDSLRILWQTVPYVFRELFKRSKTMLKFGGISFLSYLVDYGLYNFVFLRIIPTGPYQVAICYCCARILSAVFNYVMNSIFVFKHRSFVAFLKYAALALVIAIIGSFASNSLVQYLSVPKWLCKFLVDMPLWFGSYYGQKLFVFRKNDSKEE